MPKIKNCPCGLKNSYTLCCGRYHKGNIHAPTAESLMRSRYSAYVLNKTQYIYRTWDENTRPRLEQLREESNQQFTQLEIMNTTKGQSSNDTGTVEFIASYTITGNPDIHHSHENSSFKQVKNRWYYVDIVNSDD